MNGTSGMRTMCMPMQPDPEEHESVPEDLESAADQVEEAFATWQESRRLMNEMAKARGFYPVTNKLEYMQAPAWVSRDGGGHKAKAKGKGGGKPRSYGKKATATRWRKELESRTLEQTVVQCPPPLPRLHRTLQRTELLLNTASFQTYKIWSPA